MEQRLKILLIEDSEDDAELIQLALHSGNFVPQVTRVDTPEAVRSALQSTEWDVILCDYSMPKLTASEALDLLKATHKDIPFIVVSGSIGEGAAVELMKLGVHDYIIKDRLARLEPAINRELREAQNRNNRRMAEERLKNWAENMARSNEDLQRFAFVASHDLKEPLRMVSINVQLLNEKYADIFDEESRESIAYAIEGTHRMQTLIDDLLAYSRIEMADSLLSEINCNSLLLEVLDNLQSAIRGNNAKVTMDKLPTLAVDRIQMAQVFQNLVSNAIKFHAPSTRPEVHIGVNAFPGQGWVFFVRDNGIGINPAYFERIFTVFHRLHTRSKYDGNGIGLSICKKIIERRGGQIWVDSQEGKGSTFFFSVPEAVGQKFTDPNAVKREAG